MKTITMFFRSREKYYESIYKQSYKAFFVLCKRYTSNQEDAEEVFNDGMVKYFNFEKKNKIKKESRYALIKKILINTCIDWNRKKKSSFSEIDENVIRLNPRKGDIEYDIIKDELLDLIQEFPPQTRMVFNLYIFEGWPHKKIAQELNISENTSAWHLNNGKKKVLQLLDPKIKNGSKSKTYN